MPPITVTESYDAMLTSTLRNYLTGSKVEDQIGTDDPFMYHMLKKQEGGYEGISGGLGERAQMGLMYELQEFDSYAGYDVLPIVPIDGVTSAFFEWRQAAVSITISRIEERKNAGELQKINMLQTKTQQAVIAIKEGFSKGFLQGAGGTSITTARTSVANGSLFVDPLPLLVKFDPTSSTTIGGINQSTNTWWRNNFIDVGATNFASQLKKLDHLYNDCSKGPGGPPNFHMLDQNTYEWYQAALWAKHQNPSYQKADYPHENLLFHGKPSFWSQWIPNAKDTTVVQATDDGTWYMLNTQFIKVKYDKDTNFSNTPFIRPNDQDAKSAHIMWYGAACIANRRKQGVASGVDTTVSS